MRYNIETHSASIVLIGDFNPVIFSPAWFAKFGFINDDEFEAANRNENKNLLALPDLAQFSIPRFSLVVQQQRFNITTTREPFVLILDDVDNIFTRQLPHTPVAMLGINYDIRFKLDSFEQRHRLGRALAPILPWGDFGKRLERDTQTQIGGMAALVMQENPTDREAGYRRVQIEPTQNQTGVRIQINDHYQLNPRSEEGAAPVIKTLREKFEPSLAEAKVIVSQLMDFASTLQ